MKKRYIIFDFDGTLVNTNDIIMASWQATLRRYLGHELPERVIEATYGEILITSIGRLIPGADVDEAVACYRNFQDTHLDDYAVYVFEGVRELLIELRRRGYMIGVGTSRTAGSYHGYMELFDMDGLVDEAVTMDDVTRHKPEPDTAEVALKKLVAHDGREWSDDLRAEAIFIGDTKFDVGCAQNAGIDSVLVGWSHYVDEEEMKAAGFEPTYRIEKPGELLELV